VFGGSKRRSLGVSYRLGSAARVRVTVLRGNRVVRRYLTRSRLAGRTYRQSVLSRKLRRGTYRVRIVVTRPGASTTSTLTAKRL
jgi:acyl CoA:acetate/3-ketoacid CoA transferase alpha subunit